MSKIYNNGIVTTAGFQFNADLPLDDRLAVKEYADLTELTKYEGMIVYVVDELKHYTYRNNTWEIFGNDIDLYEVKGAAEAVKNELLNGAGEAYDTLKELGDLIKTNVDAIDALETIATGKVSKTGDTMTGNLNIDTRASDITPSILFKSVNGNSNLYKNATASNDYGT